MINLKLKGNGVRATIPMSV